MDEQTKRKLLRLFVGELSWKQVVKSIATIYGALLFIAVFASDWLIFFPHAPGYAKGPDVLMLETQGGPKIAARYHEEPGAKLVILYSHGNAEDIGDIPALLQLLPHEKVSVFAYDYEGYGQSEGKPSERRLYADIDAAYRYLTEVKKIPPKRIIAYGRSLGGGPSVDLASRKPLGGLILESTFMSAYRVATRYPLFPWDKFENLAKIERVVCPVLVMHGKKDRLIPVRHGEALFAAAKEPKKALWVEGAGHNDLPLVAGAEYDRALREFLRVVEYWSDGSNRR